MVRVTRKKTGHLIEITYSNGTKDIGWDWKQLLEDVRAATSAKVVVAEEVVKDTKKPVAKKTAAKKAPAKKPTAKKKKETK